jgi:hypothetical protein
LKLISKEEASHFLNKVTQSFPNFKAAIITDKNGFPIISKVPKNFPYNDNMLALEAISSHRTFINNSTYVKVKRSLDKQGSIKLLILLSKPNKFVYAYNDLREILERQSLF